MKILVGKTFGIGNACLAIPMIKALTSLGHDVDVLVGSGPDDFGAFEVFNEFRRDSRWKIYRECVPLHEVYDLAIMAIPYDGRWQNGLHFSAREVMDGRRRPGNVDRLGFDMWKKHEVEYMMENARELGFTGETPDGSFIESDERVDSTVYLGIGYKRDLGGFGESKHFGNECFSRLIRAVMDIRPETQFICSGPISDLVNAHRIAGLNFMPVGGSGGLHMSFNIVSGCHAYLGNDTGMMHVAASCGIPTMGLFAYPDLIVKNPPFCARSRALLFTPSDPPVEEIARQFVDFVWG